MASWFLSPYEGYCFLLSIVVFCSDFIVTTTLSGYNAAVVVKSSFKCLRAALLERRLHKD